MMMNQNIHITIRVFYSFSFVRYDDKYEVIKINKEDLFRIIN